MVLVVILLTVGCQNNNNENNNNVGSNENVASTNEGSDSDNQIITTPNSGLTLSYSLGLDEHGHYEDIKAAELVQLADYKNLTIPKDVHTISQERVDEGIAYVLTNYATKVEIMDRAVVDGDTLNIDFVGSIDGVEFEGGSTGGVGTEVTVGVTSYIDDFLQQLVGHMPGDTVNVEVTFPESYQEASLQGKDALFVTTINFISETVDAELTDEFVSENLSELYNSKTVEELKEDFRSAYRREDLRNYVYNYLMENSVVSSIPDEALVYQQMIVGNTIQEEAYNANVSVDEYLQSQSDYKNLQEFIDASSEMLNSRAESSLIIQAIAEEMSVLVSEEEIKGYFLEYRGSDDYSDLADKFGLPYVKKGILLESVINSVVELAVFE